MSAYDITTCAGWFKGMHCTQAQLMQDCVIAEQCKAKCLIIMQEIVIHKLSVCCGGSHSSPLAQSGAAPDVTPCPEAVQSRAFLLCGAA